MKYDLDFELWYWKCGLYSQHVRPYGIEARVSCSTPKLKSTHIILPGVALLNMQWINFNKNHCFQGNTF